MENKTTVIIIAGGEATRWDNHLSVPKHFIEINNEPILYRTIRLLKENNMNDIYVVSKNDSRYKISGTKQFIPEFNYDENSDADKFLNSKTLWNKNGRTLVLYGDVFFTDAAIKTICKFKTQEWTLFCRPFPSKFTGTGWGECFAQSFYSSDIKKHEAALHRIARLKKENKIKRCGGWEHYREMVGISHDIPFYQRKVSEIKYNISMEKNYHIIDDFTEDFDLPSDYDNFIKNYNNPNFVPKELERW